MHSELEIVDETDAPDVNLITLADLKTELEITGTSDDALLQARITRESKLIAEILNRTLALSYGVETFRLDPFERRDVLSLSLYPVEAINSVEVDGVDVTDYRVNKQNGLLYRDTVVGLCGGWSGTVVVTYSGGYQLPEKAPSALVKAVIEAVNSLTLSSSGGASGQEIRDIAHGDVRVSYYASGSTSSSSGLPQSVLDLLGPFKRPSFA